MNTLLALLAFSPLLNTPHPTEPPAKKRVFTPFEQAFAIALGGKKVDSIALYLVQPGPFAWRGRRTIRAEWKGMVQERGFKLGYPVTTFDRRRFEHTFDEPGIYALAFFRDGVEEWERHFFLMDAKWSDPRYERAINMALHKRNSREMEDILPRYQRSSYHSAY